MTWFLLVQQRVLNVETLHYESILNGLNQSWEKIRNEQQNDFGIRCLQFKICSRLDEPTIAPKRRSGALTNQKESKRKQRDTALLWGGFIYRALSFNWFSGYMEIQARI
jgi:hypothetical protein